MLTEDEDDIITVIIDYLIGLVHVSMIVMISNGIPIGVRQYITTI